MDSTDNLGALEEGQGVDVVGGQEDGLDHQLQQGEDHEQMMSPAEEDVAGGDILINGGSAPEEGGGEEGAAGGGEETGTPKEIRLEEGPNAGSRFLEGGDGAGKDGNKGGFTPQGKGKDHKGKGFKGFKDGGPFKGL